MAPGGDGIVALLAPGGDGIVDNATTNNVVEHQQEKEGDCKSSSVSSVPPTTTPTRIPAGYAAAGIPSTRILTPAAAQAALEDAWEARAFAEDLQASNGAAHHQWPPRSYTCSFCARQFRTAQALGGHMNVHRRERAQANQANQLNTLRQAAGMDAVQFQPPFRLNNLQFQAPGLGPGPITCLALADVHGGNGLPTSGSLGTASGSSGTAVAASPHIWLYQVPPLPANSNLFHANTTVMSTQPQGDRNAYPQSHPFPHFQAVKHSYPFPESHIFAQQSQSHLSHMLPLDQQSSLPSSSPFPLPSGTSGQAYFPPPTQLLWPLADHPRPQAEYKPEVVASEYYTANAKPKPSSPPAQSASNCPYSPNSPLSSPRPSQSSSSTSGLSPSDSVNVVGTLPCASGQSREILVNYVIKKCESPDPAAGGEPRPRPELMRGFQPYSNNLAVDNLAVGVAGAKAENMSRCSYSQGSHSQSSDDGKRRRLAWRRRIEEHDIDTGEQSSNPGTEPLDLELHL